MRRGRAFTPGGSGPPTAIEFLRAQGIAVSLATYDERLRTGAAALGVALYPLG